MAVDGQTAVGRSVRPDVVGFPFSCLPSVTFDEANSCRQADHRIFAICPRSPRRCSHHEVGGLLGLWRRKNAKVKPLPALKGIH